MTCCQCQAIESRFDRKKASKKLEQYRHNGPDRTTRLLIEALKAEGVTGLTLLDIGGGVGAIQHELLEAGVTGATSVEASQAYLEAAGEEAHRRGHTSRLSPYHGNFIDLAPDLPPADVVTLDRVICCYHEMSRLVELSSARAGKLYGLVYPRDRWWVRLAFAFENFSLWLQRSPFRVFVHPPEAVEAIVQANGLKRTFYQTTAVWQVVLYTR